MKLLNFNKVLCLSPHPDDIEISMSATIKTHSDTKFDIYCMTPGTSTDITTNTARYDEVNSFWNIFQCTNINIVSSNIPYFEMLTAAQWVTHLDVVLKNGYDAIFTTSNKDSHQEHVFLNSLVFPLTRNKPISIIEYKSPSTLHSWNPNMFIECSNDIFDVKIKALRESFKSQLDSTYFSKKWLEIFHSDPNCYKRNYEFIETFKIVSLFR